MIFAKITIYCEEGINLNYFFHNILKPLIHYRLLKTEKCLVHCSAFIYRTMGILLFGYGGSGRTTVLMEFLKNGAKFVSDDHTIISSNGTFYGLSQTISLENYSQIGSYGKNHFELFS